MFGLGKKKKTVLGEETLDPRLAQQIHVMPERFYVAPKKQRGTLWLMIVLAVVVIGSLATAAYFLNQSLRSNQIALEQNRDSIAVNQAANKNVAVNQPVNQNLNLQPVATSSPTGPTSTNTNVDTNTNQNQTNQNTNSNSNTNTGQHDNLSPMPSAADDDADGLTAEEETLYGTNSNQADSDGDGYSDGNEVLNGYNPSKAKESLIAAGVFKVYSSSFYHLSYPASWHTEDLATDKSEVVFQAGTGEFIELIIVNKNASQTLAAWYQAQYPAIPFDTVTSLRVNNLDGLRSPDQLNYYFANPNNPTQVFLITYNPGNLTQINFASTFSAMVKSFSLTSTP